jgi:hypothetical protein
MIGFDEDLHPELGVPKFYRIIGQGGRTCKFIRNRKKESESPPLSIWPLMRLGHLGRTHWF